MIYVITQGNASDFKAKIGISSDPESRLKTLQTGSPKDLKLSFSFPVPDDKELEVYLHQRFEDRRLNGEWFDFSNTTNYPEKVDWYYYLLADDCPVHLKTCQCSICKGAPVSNKFPRLVEYGMPIENNSPASYRMHYECPGCFLRTQMAHSKKDVHRFWNEVHLTLLNND
jgi:hypothetical protein